MALKWERKMRLSIRLSAAVICLALLMAAIPASALADVSANPKSMIYHNINCLHYGCKSCTKTFKTAEEARKAGYRACKKCGG